VGVQKHVEPPAYLKKNPYVDMASLVALDEEDAFRNVNVLNEDEWPDNKSHGLDRSQSQALKRILTSRLAIVQGPPGTGKTYVSVVSLRVLLANMTKDDPSIIVTCQTNHALDQLLRHVAEFEPNFIRLGGRSKDKGKIKERTLYEVRGNMSQQKAEGSLKRRSMVALKKLTSTMQMILAPLEANKPPLDHRVLRDLGIITPEQAQSLEMDSLCAMGMSAESAGVQMEQWLGKSLIHRDRPLQPDDFGAEFEEEDFEVEQLQELEAEAVAQDDDDFETLPGPRTLLSGDNLIGRGGRTAEEIKMLLQKTDSQDLYTIPSRERGAVYNYFLREAKREICVQFRKHAKEYQKLVSQRKIGQWEQDLRILGGQRVIGMTTTGLSKYRGLIAALRPRIVVVEEAAETLEAPVTAACLPSLEHLILVGDHQQLRPHCQVRELEDLNFNLSLFERMVINGVELDTLTRQRRMIPEIRRLLEPIYGSTLRDHPSVAVPSNRPPVEGMGGCNSFLFTHEWLESCDGNKSALNEKEADMVVGFFDYLVLNGVDPSTITVLTFYNGQRKTITKRLRQHSNTGAIPPSSLNIVTVDSYQGEENDIVILSLVRSNLKHKIGFLSVDNRVCVALSRAKRGFYMFGNAEMLACESAVWAEVVDILYGKKSKKDPNKRRNVGYHLPLQCNKHGRRTWIKGMYH
jgi:helicase required for RNAi-mediated heterochromatin assembly 1